LTLTSSPKEPGEDGNMEWKLSKPA